MLRDASPVTAIIAGNDTIALGVLEAAKPSNVDVPAKLSIIGFDGMPFAGSPLVALTSIRQPVEAMACTAARRLVERIRMGGVTAPSHDVPPIQLIRRDSTGPCKGFAAEPGTDDSRNPGRAGVDAKAGRCGKKLRCPASCAQTRQPGLRAGRRGPVTILSVSR
jgi:hypothetical protein